MAAALGCLTGRVLSGQRRPELTREEGIRLAAEGIEACLPHAAAAGITLVIENHYKDDFWQYLEFAQAMDLRREVTSIGYARRLRHGEIGKGLNDYDAIFAELRSAGFDGWVSIEDGVEGMDELKRSARFLRGKMRTYWP